MLIYNLKAPTINHSYHYDLYCRLNTSIKTYESLKEYVFNEKDLEEIEEKQFNQYIYYSYNADKSSTLLFRYKPEELQELIDEQIKTTKLELDSLYENKLISKPAYKETLTQYENILFINNIWFDIEYVKEVISYKNTQLQSDVIINTWQSHISSEENKIWTQSDKIDDNKKQQIIKISKKAIREISQYSPYIKLDNKEYHIKWQEDILSDTNRYIYVVGSRQIWKSLVFAELGLEECFKPMQKILMCSFSNTAINNMRDYLLEFISKFPDDTFTYFKKENFVVNNVSRSKIYFRTLAEEWNGIRWMTLNTVIIDESAFVSNDVYDRVLFPTTTTTRWRIFALSTPDQKNWFYDKVMDWLTWRQSNTSVYQIDYTQNPFIYSDPELLDYITRNKHDPRIRYEYMCEFVWDGMSVFDVKMAEFFPTLTKTWFYTLSYDPARKWTDRAWFALSYTYHWKTILIKSWAIPLKEKQQWITQAQFLKDIQIQYNAALIMDVSWVWDWVIQILKQHGLNINMAVQYIWWVNHDKLDQSYPYGSTESYKVSKAFLINNTINYFDEWVFEIYEHTNKDLLQEVYRLTPKKWKLWELLFDTSFFDDITNAMMLNVYYIYKKSLLTKTPQLEEETNDPHMIYNPYSSHTISRVW